MVNEATASSLLRKLGELARSLDPDERELFAALLGPGVTAAIGSAEVQMFAYGGQESDRLAQALTELARRAQPTPEDDARGSPNS
jgi:ubiquinone biosynthesis protein UbiJ